jgi:hypothetical protein
VTLASLVIAVLQMVVSITGLIFGTAGRYGDPIMALGPTASSAGILIPGWLGHDLFNLVVGVPLVGCAVWLAGKGRSAVLLLWPGALYYCLYTYAIYLIGAPFSILFLLYALLVGLSAFTTLALMAVIDRAAVQERLAPTVPARLVGGLLVILALVTLAQGATGLISTSRAAGVPLERPARPVWAADLTIEVPAVLLGGILLWRRTALGYAAGAGLLQYGLTPLALAASMVLQAVVGGSALDPAAVGYSRLPRYPLHR